MTVPDGFDDFQFWLTGTHFPATSETSLGAYAAALVQAGDALPRVVPMITTASQQLRDSGSGKSVDAFVAALDRYTTDPGYIAIAAQALTAQGEGLHHAGGEVMYAKYMVATTLAELISEFFVAMAMAAFFPELLSELAMRLLVGRLMIAEFLAQAITAVVQAELIGIGLQVAMDLVAQAVALSRHQIDNIDFSKTARAAGIGAVAGLAGLGAGVALQAGISTLLKDGVKQGFKEYLGEVSSETAGEVLGDLAGSSAYHEAVDGKGAGSDSTSGLTSGHSEFFGGHAGRGARAHVGVNAGLDNLPFADPDLLQAIQDNERINKDPVPTYTPDTSAGETEIPAAPPPTLSRPPSPPPPYAPPTPFLGDDTDIRVTRGPGDEQLSGTGPTVVDGRGTGSEGPVRPEGVHVPPPVSGPSGTTNAAAPPPPAVTSPEVAGAPTTPEAPRPTADASAPPPSGSTVGTSPVGGPRESPPPVVTSPAGIAANGTPTTSPSAGTPVVSTPPAESTTTPRPGGPTPISSSPLAAAAAAPSAATPPPGAQSPSAAPPPGASSPIISAPPSVVPPPVSTPPAAPPPTSAPTTSAVTPAAETPSPTPVSSQVTPSSPAPSPVTPPRVTPSSVAAQSVSPGAATTGRPVADGVPGQPDSVRPGATENGSPTPAARPAPAIVSESAAPTARPAPPAPVPSGEPIDPALVPPPVPPKDTATTNRASGAVLWNGARNVRVPELAHLVTPSPEEIAPSGNGRTHAALRAEIRRLRRFDPEADPTPDGTALNTRRLMDWIRTVAQDSTSSAAMRRLNLPSNGRRRLNVEVQIGYPAGPARESPAAANERRRQATDLANWVAAMANRQLGAGIADWAARRTTLQVPPQVNVTTSVVADKSSKPGWIGLRYIGDTETSVPGNLPQIHAQQRVAPLDGRTLALGRDPVTGELTDDATARMGALVFDVADRAVRWHLANGPSLSIQVAGPQEDSSVRMVERVGRLVRTGVRGNLVKLLGRQPTEDEVYQIAKRVQVTSALLPAGTRTTPTDPAASIELHVSVPPLLAPPRPTTKNDEPPTRDYLDPWRTSPVPATNIDPSRPSPVPATAPGWWDAVSPIYTVPQIIEHLPESSFRPVHVTSADPAEHVRATTTQLTYYTYDVRYDVARVDVRTPGSKQPKYVRIFRLRLHLDKGPGVSDNDVERLRDLALAAVARDINERFQLPDGDQFHLAVEFTDAASAHTTINIRTDHATNSLQWSTTLLDPPNHQQVAEDSLLHELLHLLGLPDEYPEDGRDDYYSVLRTRPPAHSATDQVTTLAGRRVPRVYELPAALMHAVWRPTEDIIAARYLMQIAMVQENHVEALTTAVHVDGLNVRVDSTPVDTWTDAGLTGRLLDNMRGEDPKATNIRLADSWRAELEAGLALGTLQSSWHSGKTWAVLPDAEANRFSDDDERFLIRVVTESPTRVPPGYQVLAFDSKYLVYDDPAANGGKLAFIPPSVTVTKSRRLTGLSTFFTDPARPAQGGSLAGWLGQTDRPNRIHHDSVAGLGVSWATLAANAGHDIARPDELSPDTTAFDSSAGDWFDAALHQPLVKDFVDFFGLREGVPPAAEKSGLRPGDLIDQRFLDLLQYALAPRTGGVERTPEDRLVGTLTLLQGISAELHPDQRWVSDGLRQVIGVLQSVRPELAGVGLTDELISRNPQVQALGEFLSERLDFADALAEPDPALGPVPRALRNLHASVARLAVPFIHRATNEAAVRQFVATLNQAHHLLREIPAPEFDAFRTPIDSVWSLMQLSQLSGTMVQRRRARAGSESTDQGGDDATPLLDMLRSAWGWWQDLPGRLLSSLARLLHRLVLPASSLLRMAADAWWSSGGDTGSDRSEPLSPYYPWQFEHWVPPSFGVTEDEGETLVDVLSTPDESMTEFEDPQAVVLPLADVPTWAMRAAQSGFGAPPVPGETPARTDDGGWFDTLLADPVVGDFLNFFGLRDPTASGTATMQGLRPEDAIHRPLLDAMRYALTPVTDGVTRTPEDRYVGLLSLVRFAASRPEAHREWVGEGLRALAQHLESLRPDLIDRQLVSQLLGLDHPVRALTASLAEEFTFDDAWIEPNVKTDVVTKALRRLLTSLVRLSVPFADPRTGQAVVAAFRNALTDADRRLREAGLEFGSFRASVYAAMQAQQDSVATAVRRPPDFDALENSGFAARERRRQAGAGAEPPTPASTSEVLSGLLQVFGGMEITRDVTVVYDPDGFAVPPAHPEDSRHPVVVDDEPPPFTDVIEQASDGTATLEPYVSAPPRSAAPQPRPAPRRPPHEWPQDLRERILRRGETWSGLRPQDLDAIAAGLTPQQFRMVTTAVGRRTDVAVLFHIRRNLMLTLMMKWPNIFDAFLRQASADWMAQTARPQNPLQYFAAERPEVLNRIERDQAILGVYFNQTSLDAMKRLGDRWPALLELGWEKTVVQGVAQAIGATPLGDALAAHPNPVGAIRKLRENFGLLDPLITNATNKGDEVSYIAGEPWTRERYDQLLRDPELTDRTDDGPQRLFDLLRYPAVTWAVINVTGMSDAVVRDSASYVPLLNRYPDLVDVLVENPVLAQSLADDPALFEAAGKNPLVVDMLSADPGHFDAVPGPQLADAFAATPAPQPPDARHGEQPWQAAVAGNRRLRMAVHGVHGQQRPHPSVIEALTRIIRMGRAPGDDAKAVIAMFENDELQPHEYRRLLRSPRVQTLVRKHPDARRPEILQPLLRSSSLLSYFDVPDAGASRRLLFTAVRTQDIFRQALRRSGSFRFLLMFLAQSSLLGTLLDKPHFFEELPDDELILAVTLPSTTLTDPLPEELVRAMTAEQGLVLRLIQRHPSLQVTWQIVPPGFTEGVRDGLAAHPAVVRLLVATPNRLLHPGHWEALLRAPAFFAFLDGHRDLAGFLAARPELLVDIASRVRPGTDDFERLLGEPWTNGGQASIQDAIRAIGGVRLHPDGVPVGDARLRRLAEYFRLPDGEPAERLLTGTDDLSPDEVRLLRTGREVLLATPDLAAAVRGKPSLATTFVVTPGLIGVLAERAELRDYALGPDGHNLLTAALKSPKLVGALASHPNFYHAYLREPAVRPEYIRAGAAGVAIRNPEFYRLMGEHVPLLVAVNQVGGSAVQLVQFSSEATALVLTGDPAVLTLLGRQAFVDKLLEHFEKSPPSLLAAVLSDLGAAEYFAAHLDAIELLAEHPALAEAMARFHRRLAVADYPDILGERFAEQLARHPEQAERVLASADMLRAAAAAPEIVPAMANAPDLAALLNDSEPVRSLVRTRPEVIPDLIEGRFVTELRALPRLAEFLAGDAARLRLLRTSPALVTALTNNRSILPALTDDAGLGAVLARHPSLTEKLTSRALRALRTHTGLRTALAEHPATLSADLWRQVLRDGALLRLLDGRPGFAAQFQTDSDLRQLYTGDPENFRTAVERSTPSPVRVDVAQLHDAMLAISRPAAPAVRPEQPRTEPATGPSAVATQSPAEAASASQVPAETWLADQVNASEEISQLLATPGMDAVVDALAGEPELLLLLLARPDLAGALALDPTLVTAHLFRSFLDRPEAPTDFVKAYALYLHRLDLSLDDPWKALFRDAAAVTWARVHAERDAAWASQEKARATRMANVRPGRSQTWEMSGRLLFAGRLVRDKDNPPSKEAPYPFSTDDWKVLERIAESLQGMQETSAALNRELHAHLGGGYGGVSFVLLLEADGRVTPMFYAISRNRNGNQYYWEGAGTQPYDGPLGRTVVAEDQPYQDSLDLLRNRAALAVAQPATGSSGRGTTVRPAPDRHAGLRQQLAERYRARTAAPAGGGTSGRKGKGKAKSSGQRRTAPSAPDPVSEPPSPGSHSASGSTEGGSTSDGDLLDPADPILWVQTFDHKLSDVDFSGDTVRVIDWIMDMALQATRDDGMSELDLPPGRQRLDIEVEIGLPDDVAGQINAKDLGDRLVAMITTRMGAGLADWAARQDSPPDPPLPGVTSTVVRAAPGSGGWIRLHYLGNSPAPPAVAPPVLRGARRIDPLDNRMVLAGRDTTGDLTADARQQLLTLGIEIADRAIAWNQANGPDLTVQVIGGYDATLPGGEADGEAGATLVTQLLTSAIRDRLDEQLPDQASDVSSIDVFQRIHMRMTSVAYGVHRGPGETGGPLPVLVSVEAPPLPAPSRPATDDNVAPTGDYLDPWRTSPAFAAGQGWWELTSPIADLPAVIASLPETSFRPVRVAANDPAVVTYSDGTVFDSWVWDAAYDVARVAVRTDSPEPAYARIFRLRLHLRPEAGTSDEIVAEMREHALAAVERDINGRFRLPNGDQFHLVLEFTGEDSAHHVIDLRATEHSTSFVWSTDLRHDPDELHRDRTLVHEILHLLGLRDEYPGDHPLRDAIFRPGQPAGPEPGPVNPAPPLAGRRVPGVTQLPPAVMGSTGNVELMAVRYLILFAMIQESQVLAPLTAVTVDGPDVRVTAVPVGTGTDITSWGMRAAGAGFGTAVRPSPAAAPPDLDAGGDWFDTLLADPVIADFVDFFGLRESSAPATSLRQGLRPEDAIDTRFLDAFRSAITPDSGGVTRAPEERFLSLLALARVVPGHLRAEQAWVRDGLDALIRRLQRTRPSLAGQPVRIPDEGRAVTAMREAAALLPTRSVPGHSMDRLHIWVTMVERGTFDTPSVDCVPLALGAFTALHGRLGGVGPADDTITITPTIADLERLTGGTFAAARDTNPAALRTWVASTPGAALLINTARPGEPGHVYWIVADDRSSTVRLRLVDPQRPGAFIADSSSVDARLDEDLTAPGTRFLAVDGDGYGRPVPGPTASRGDRDRTAEAMLDPSEQTAGRQPGTGRSRAPAEHWRPGVLEQLVEQAPQWGITADQIRRLPYGMATDLFQTFASALGRRPELIGLFVRQRRLVEKMITRWPNVFAATVRMSPFIVKSTADGEGTLNVLAERHPAALDRFEQDRGLFGAYFNEIGLNALWRLGDRWELLLKFGWNLGVTQGFARLIAHGPLAEALAAHPDPEAAIRNLLGNLGLLDLLYTATLNAGDKVSFIAAEPWTRQQYEQLLSDPELAGRTGDGPRRLFDLLRHPAVAWAVVNVSGMLDAVVRDSGRYVPLLMAHPDLVDVLVESPALAARLAADSGLFAAAAANSAVAEMLSADPGHFDAVPERELADAFADTVRPEPVDPPPSPQQPWQLALANNRRLRLAVQGVRGQQRQHASVRPAQGDLIRLGAKRLDAVAPVVIDMLKNDTLQPHEYRRLLRSPVTQQLVADRPGTERSEILQPLLRSVSLTRFLQADGRAPGQRALFTATRDSEEARQALRWSGALRYYLEINGPSFVIPDLLQQTSFLAVLPGDELILSIAPADATNSPRTLTPDFMSALTQHDGLILRFAERHPVLQGIWRRQSKEFAHLVGAHLAPHPAVVRMLAASPNQLLGAGHWEALLSNRGFFAFLDQHHDLAAFLTDRQKMLRDVASRLRPDTRNFEVLLGTAWEAVRANDEASQEASIEAAIQGLGELRLLQDGITRKDPRMMRLAEYFRLTDEKRAEGVLAAEKDVPPDAVRALRGARQTLLRVEDLAAVARKNLTLAMTFAVVPEFVDLLAQRADLQAHAVGTDGHVLFEAVLATPELVKVFAAHPQVVEHYMREVELRPLYADPVHARGTVQNPEFTLLLTEHRDLYIEVNQIGPDAASLVQLSAAATELLLTSGTASVPLLRQATFVAAMRSHLDKSPEVVAAAMRDLPAARYFAAHLGSIDLLAQSAPLTDALGRLHRQLSPGDDYDAIFHGGLLEQLRQFPHRAADVFASADMLRLAAQVPAVVEALGRAPDLAALLIASGAVRDLIRSRPEIVPDLAAGRFIAELRALPRLAPFLARDAANLTQLRNFPGLLAAMVRNRAILGSVDGDTRLGIALAQHPNLTDALTARGLHALKSRPALVALLAKERASLPPDLWTMVLRDGTLLRLLDGRPILAAQFLTDSDLHQLYRDNPRYFIEVIEIDPIGVRVETAQVAAAMRALERRAEPSEAAGRPATRADEPAGAPAPGPATQVAARPRVPEKVAWMVDELNTSDEIRGLLQRPGTGAVWAAIGSAAELLPLLLGRPDIAGELAEDPSRVTSYLFREFLSGREALTTFGKAYDSYLDEHYFALAEPWSRLLREGAEITWNQVRAEREAARASAEVARANRLDKLLPDRSESWEMSGQLLFAKRLVKNPDDQPTRERPHPFSADDWKVLTGIAESLQAVREDSLALHKSLHAHLGGGSGGVSFVLLLDADARVTPLFYGVSRDRSDNSYNWEGAGGQFAKGPLPKLVVDDDPRVAASRDRLEDRGSRPVTAGPSTVVLVPDPSADLRKLLADHYQARTAVATASATPAASGSQPRKGGKNKGKSKGKAVAQRVPQKTEADGSLEATRDALTALGLRVHTTDSDHGRTAEAVLDPSGAAGARRPAGSFGQHGRWTDGGNLPVRHLARTGGRVWLVGSARVIIRDLIGPRAGVALVSDEVLAGSLASVPAGGYPVLVRAAAGGESVVVPVAGLDGGAREVPLDPEWLGDILAERPAAKQGIVLVPSDGGRLTDGFRQRLADRLGADVRTPQEQAPSRHALAALREAAALVWRQPEEGPSIDRLEHWIGEVRHDDPETPPVDCLPLAMGAFLALHGRLGNLTTSSDDGGLTSPTLDDLQETLGARLVAARDIDAGGLWAKLTSEANSAVLVSVAPPNRPGHVYWIAADNRSGEVVPRLVDPQLPRAFDSDQPAVRKRFDADLAAIGTRVLALDPSGRPAELAPPVAGALGASPSVEALFDPALMPGRRPGTGRGRSTFFPTAVSRFIPTRRSATQPGNSVRSAPRTQAHQLSQAFEQLSVAGPSSGGGSAASNPEGGTFAQHGGPSLHYRSATVRAAYDLIGKLEWRGTSRVDTSNNWQEDATLENGYPNDFIRWVRGSAGVPGEYGVMNCLQALLFSAYRAGKLSVEQIREMHRSTSEVASRQEARSMRPNVIRDVFRSQEWKRSKGSRARSAGKSAYDRQWQIEMTRGLLATYTTNPVTGIGNTVIPEGNLIFFDRIDHVALSLGRLDAQGRQLVLSHLNFPQKVQEAFRRRSNNLPDEYGFMQETTVEELVEYLGIRKVEFGDASWA